MQNTHTRAKIRFMQFLLEPSVKGLLFYTSDNCNLMVTHFAQARIKPDTVHVSDSRRPVAFRSWMFS